MTQTNKNIKSQFNEEFCTQVEYRICHEIEKSENPDLKGFWCDGVSWSPDAIQLTKKHVNDNRKIVTKAWIGPSGQEEYEATIQFGKKALSYYAKDKDLIECIPDIKSETDWIELNIENKSIKIRLI